MLEQLERSWFEIGFVIGGSAGGPTIDNKGGARLSSTYAFGGIQYYWSTCEGTSTTEWT